LIEFFYFIEWFCLYCLDFVCFLVFYGNFFRGVLFCDSLSFFLVFLTVWIFLFCVISNLVDKWVNNYFFSYVFFLGFIFFFLFVCFSCFNMFLFYLGFEFIFVLMFLFLLRWGYSPERLQASFYIIFYTLVVSFPFLLFLIIIGLNSFVNSFFFVGSFVSFWWIFLFFVFLVKLPIYGVHL